MQLNHHNLVNDTSTIYFRKMKCFAVLITAILFFSVTLKAQAPSSWSSGQIVQAINKLQVLGSVLYIAAHPDDENTRLITYLANDKLYRTGYLSLTRGDGGQNLIGDEQGVELGLIRTQELLAARRIDGGEQYFSSAYDFGFSKNPQETFAKWNKEKILGDVVWVIRNFQPDVIITRFPTTGEGGHGHHTASAILANEAFTAAADARYFPEQLKYVKPWKAKRILWNTFNFGGNNTTAPNQFNINVGGYNALLGKSYGEIAAQSRSQHKSQGFGSAANRGESFEFFKTTGGDAPQNNLLDGVNTSWARLGKEGASIQKMISDVQQSFKQDKPQSSIPAFVQLYNAINKLKDTGWKQKKLQEVKQLILQCSGLYIDATTAQAHAVQTDSIAITLSANNRLGAAVNLKSVEVGGNSSDINKVLVENKNFSYTKTLGVPVSKEMTQPFWLKEKMDNGSFKIDDQHMIGVADVQPAYMAKFHINVSGTNFTYEVPVRYRSVDAVKGEVYQPLYVIPAATVSTNPGVLLFKGKEHAKSRVYLSLHANNNLPGNIRAALTGIDYSGPQQHEQPLQKGKTRVYNFEVSDTHTPPEEYTVTAYANQKIGKDTAAYYLSLRSINYDHIPSIKYFYPDYIKALNIDLKTAGKKVGYIPGAGDKVPDVLEQMGYDVTMLDETALKMYNLKQFDAIITGIRAYNTNTWLDEYYEKLMQYVKDGGNMIVQYNTSNNIGRVKSKIGPYDFNISRNRITDENAKVNIMQPSHKVFNYPNKITQEDFNGWIQERSIYHASGWNDNLKPLLSMADPGEAGDDGALITGKYGNGYFTYTGLVFFRQLPAAVPGALRLMANLIGMNKD